MPGRGEDLPPPTVAARIDGACDRFEAAWQAGLRPRIEEALAAEPRDWHPELLRCLLAVELAYRARRGEHLASADYRARFPGAAEVIRAAFEALPAVAPGAAGPRATGLGSPDPGRGSPGAIHEPGRPSVATDRRTASDPEAALGCSPRSTGLRFRVLRPHARGGLGEVFVAHDEELNREVALKEILGRFADDPVQRARFLREAEIAGRLEHPGIVPVHGLGRYRDGRPYYAMRLVKGHTFQEAIDHFHGARAPGRDPGKRSLTLRQLLGRFIAVCNAIAYAHSQGIVHRDLKPDNILLGPFGETLVVDWGLAKPIGPPHDGPGVTAEVFRATPVGGSLPTQTGSVVGTPAYMSPEQAAGRLDLVGPASDVYSLGATLYCLLTGRAPVEDPDLDVVLRKVRRGEFRSPRQVNPASDPALEAICSKAMARGPSDRYASPRDLADDLEHWLADEPVSAWREPPWTRSLRWAQRHRTALAGLTAALAVAGLSVGIERLRNDGRPVSPQVEVREVVFPGQADASSREDPTAPVLLPTVLTQIG
ncbi:MAG TPA: serine/threonine-protein kinase, partial [Isosphaeraceae bacterium]